MACQLRVPVLGFGASVRGLVQVLEDSEGLRLGSPLLPVQSGFGRPAAARDRWPKSLEDARKSREPLRMDQMTCTTSRRQLNDNETAASIIGLGSKSRERKHSHDSPEFSLLQGFEACFQKHTLTPSELCFIKHDAFE